MSMRASSFGAKPNVLRCSRCGRFVNWEEARLQNVCECRSHVPLPPVFIRDASPDDRAVALELFKRDFGHKEIVAFGEVIPLEHVPAIVAEMKGELAGALAYRELPAAVHIVALATDPMWQRSGVGGHLVAEIELAARRRKLPSVVVATTNDNLPAMYFYQRRGYVISEMIAGGVLAHLSGGSVAGFAGIPIRDEVRMKKELRD
jgi:ribosomal protein S18 acetylase RimI-like enzyme